MRPVPSWSEYRRYPVTAWTAVVAAVISFAWWAGANISPLLAAGGLRQGELWRLVTSVFLHVDIVHLAFNLYWIWAFGTCVEAVYGYARTAGLFFLLALVSSSFQFALGGGGVGLSGVNYGLLGLLWIMVGRDERFRDAIDSKTVSVFLLWFLACLWLSATNTYAVGNIAHGAGLILGVLIGIAIRNRRRVLAGIAIGAMILFGLWGSTVGRPIINGYEQADIGYKALVDNRNEEAARWLHKAVVFEPKAAWIWLNLGIAYQRLHDRALAKAAFERAYDLDPELKSNSLRGRTSTEK